MPIFIRFILPFIIIVAFHVYLSLKDNKFLGLIIPISLLIFTIIMLKNALEWVGVLVAIVIMIIPNILSFLIYFYCRKYKKRRDEKIIKLKFKDR